MPACRHKRLKLMAFSLVLAGVSGLATALPSSTVSAQGLFNFFFGSPRREAPPSANAYADPYPGYERRRRSEPSERRSSGGSAAYCVRLCDGRYFPIQRTGNSNPAQLCSAFCPAAATKVFSGSNIDHASASDGSRYSSLNNAFVYRDKTVDGCTCNGKDPYGLVTLRPEDDPTLRNGDIVATTDGFVSYSGGRRQNAEFTPVDGDAQRRLSETKIMPNAIPESAQTIPEESASAQRKRRAQAAR